MMRKNFVADTGQSAMDSLLDSVAADSEGAAMAARWCEYVGRSGEKVKRISLNLRRRFSPYETMSSFAVATCE
jgi:hypothetical protein